MPRPLGFEPGPRARQARRPPTVFLRLTHAKDHHTSDVAFGGFSGLPQG